MSKDRIDIKEVFLRRLRGDEFNAYAALLAEADSVHHDALPDLIKPPDRARPAEQDFTARLRDPDCLLDVAVVRLKDGTDVIAGLVDAHVLDRPEGRVHAANRVVRIEVVVVSEAWRRRGLGRMLLDRVKTWSAARAADRIVLNVYAFNIVAARLYEKAGFSVMTKMYAQPVP